MSQLLRLHVDVVDHVCVHRGGKGACDPVELAETLRGKKAVVIKGIYDEEHLRLYREAAIRAGLNPHLVAVVDYRWSGSAVDLAREALAADWVADMSPEVEAKISYTRREVLSGKVGAYRDRLSAPVYLSSACGGLYRTCDICARACPYGAISVDPKSGISIDYGKCQSCGACAAACPMGALQMPHFPDSSFAAMGKLEGEKVVSCFKHAGESVKVECLAELGAVDLLSLRAGGPVRLICPDDSCPLAGNLKGLRGLVAELNEIYGGFYFGSEAAQPKEGKAPPRPAPSRDRASIALSLMSPESAAALGARELSVDPEACTLCEACAKWCPTGALSIERRGGSSALVYDPAKCIGCDACVRACPEQTPSGARAIYSSRLSGGLGPRELFSDENVYCRVCGAFVGTRRTLERVRRIMESRGMKVDPEMLELCPKHRAQRAFARAWGAQFGPKVSSG